MSLVGTIQEVATAIAKAGIGEEAFGNMSRAFDGITAKGLENTGALNRIGGVAKSLLRAGGAKEVASALNLQDVGDDAAKAVSDEIARLSKTKTGVGKIYGAAKKIAADPGSFGLDDEAIKSFTDMSKKYETFRSATTVKARDQALGELFGRTGKEGAGLGAVTSGFFGDPELGSARKLIVGGIYGGGALGLRTLSGGDLTHNARGENDIAGIPFV